MLKRISKIINQPFPETDNPKQVLSGMTLAAIIVFLLLYLFQPFGLSEIDENLLGVCISFGVITLIVGMAFEYFVLHRIPVNRKSSSWTLKHWIISMLTMILCIAIANYCFMVFITRYFTFDWTFFLLMIGNTFAVAIVPTVIAGLVTQNRNLKKNIITASEIDNAIHIQKPLHNIVEIKSSEQEETITCHSDELCFIESMQNYISIYICRNEKMEKYVLRNSLKNTCAQICNHEIIRCHRSYMVNVVHVLKVTGNAQGLTLHLPFEQEVPVSRSYIKSIRAAIKSD